MSIYQKIGIGFFVFGLFGFIVTLKTDLFAAIVGGSIFCLIGYYFYRKSNNYLRAKKESKQKEMEEKIKAEQYRKTHFKAVHQAGLPIAEGAECVVGYEKDKFVFDAAGHNFNLAFDRITDMSIKTEEEIYKQYVSSVGGAVGGAVLFGPLGAIIGGRVKEKNSKRMREYLIFTYLKEGKIECISFEVTDTWFEAGEIVELFNENNKVLEKQTIDL